VVVGVYIGARWSAHRWGVVHQRGFLGLFAATPFLVYWLEH
jgi:hypothetical protein